MPQKPRKRKPVTLRDRMDALTQTVELLASIHKDTERQVEKTSATVDRLADVVKPIVQLVLDHEERLNRLEGS